MAITHRSRPLVRVSLALAAWSLIARAWAGIPEPGFTDSLVVGGLTSPTAIAFLPDGRLLITEKAGALKLFDGSATTTLATIPVCSGSEMGLLGIAVDPNFSTNGFLYLYRTKGGAGGCGASSGRFNEVVRVAMSGGSVSLASLSVLLSGIATDNGNHNGGVLRVGPDGKLWVGVGDTGLGDNIGGPGSATNPYAQELGSLNGKILRMNLDGTVPGDNPFAGMATARGEIWAYGFRNPFRMSFDSATGKLWIGDVGDSTVEEIDIGVRGGNYSWPRCEGDLQGPPGSPQPCAPGGDIAPAFTYRHGGSGSLGGCVIGGTFAGSAFGSMAGDYVFGDCTSSRIYRAALDATRTDFAGAPERVSTSAATPADFATGPDGAVYYPAIGAGEVRRLAAATVGHDAPLAGEVLILKDRPSHPALRTLNASSKDGAIDLGGGPGSAGDPRLSGGSLRVLSEVGAFDDTYLLPASRWTHIGDPVNGYVYKDLKLSSGPVSSATLKDGTLLEVLGRGAKLGHTLGANPDPVTIVLQVGAKRYCMSFGAGGGATSKFTPGTQFSAKRTSAPAACPQ